MYDELDQRLNKWLPRYPDVHVALCAAPSGVVASLAEKDANITLVVIGDAHADQLTRLIGAHGHPLFAHPHRSVPVVHPSRRWSAAPNG